MKTDRNFTIEIPISQARIEDILCTMWENAPSIIEWAESSGQIPPDGATPDYYWQYPMRGGSLMFKDIEADDGETYELDESAVLNGLVAMAQKSPDHFADIILEKDDSTTADVFLQYALFGEIKYA